MKSFLFSVLLLLLAACGDEYNTTAPDTDNRIVKGSIKGTLLDSITNTPIVGAFITTDPLTSTTRSDENGIFELPNVGPDIYNLIITHDEYFRYSARIKVSDQITNDIELKMISYESVNTAPDKPLLVFPANTSSISFKSFSFRWFTNDIDKDSLLTDLYFSVNGGAFELLKDDISAKTYSFQYDFIETVEYRWYVVVKDKYASAISDTNTFTFKDLNITEIPNLKAYLKFDKDGVDLGPYKFETILQNVTFVDDRYSDPNNAASFKGQSNISSKIILPKSFQLDSQFTISLWVKPDPSLGENGNVGYFECVSKWGAAAKGHASWAFGIQKDSKLFLSTYNTSSTDRLSTKTITKLIWQHIAVTYRNGNATFYLNGKLDNTVSGLQLPQNSDLSASIGGRQDQLSSYHGAIDDLYIFDRQLNDDEILKLYQE